VIVSSQVDHVVFSLIIPLCIFDMYKDTLCSCAMYIYLLGYRDLHCIILLVTYDVFILFALIHKIVMLSRLFYC